MRFAKQWAFTAWWGLALLGWAFSAQAGLERSSEGVAKQIVLFMPAWGAPWAVPLAAIRAIDVPGGTAYGFELALGLGLATCVLLDLARRRRISRVPQVI